MRDEPERPTFSDLLRRLGREGEPPDQETFVALWEALRAALVAELRKRGLWQSSPCFLGVYGAESWQEGEKPGHSLAGRSLDPLDELVADCYAYTFVDRLRALRAQLEVKPNVDGLVFLNIRHFLHERQKEHDPLGFQIFEALRKAVRKAVEAGELEVLEGDPRVRNETVLGFRSGAGPVEQEPVDLAPLVQQWNDELLPDLVTAHGRGRQPVLGTLQRRLRDLEGRGFEAIRFKDLVDPLKQDVRSRWADLLEREVAEVEADEAARQLNAMAHLFRPDFRYEEREAFRALVCCISELLDRFQDGEATRRHLDRLWGFLRTWAGQGEELEGFPSHRKLAGLLEIPRDRLPELFGVLRQAATECEKTLFGATSHPSREGPGQAHAGDEEGAT